jgi:hypothetical protein
LLVGEPFVALLAVVHEHVSDGEGCGNSTDDCCIMSAFRLSFPFP